MIRQFGIKLFRPFFNMFFFFLSSCVVFSFLEPSLCVDASAGADRLPSTCNAHPYLSVNQYSHRPITERHYKNLTLTLSFGWILDLDTWIERVKPALCSKHDHKSFGCISHGQNVKSVHADETANQNARFEMCA